MKTSTKPGFYRVTVCVTLVAGRKHMLGLAREIELPFVPFPGLWLAGINGIAEDQEGDVVRHVTWDVRTGTFRVDLDPMVEPKEPISELLAHWGPDWTILEPGKD